MFPFPKLSFRTKTYKNVQIHYLQIISYNFINATSILVKKIYTYMNEGKKKGQ